MKMQMLRRIFAGKKCPLRRRSEARQEDSGSSERDAANRDGKAKDGPDLCAIAGCRRFRFVTRTTLRGYSNLRVAVPGATKPEWLFPPGKDTLKRATKGQVNPEIAH
jgi:hypothetical protein